MDFLSPEDLAAAGQIDPQRQALDRRAELLRALQGRPMQQYNTPIAAGISAGGHVLNQVLGHFANQKLAGEQSDLNQRESALFGRLSQGVAQSREGYDPMGLFSADEGTAQKAAGNLMGGVIRMKDVAARLRATGSKRATEMAGSIEQDASGREGLVPQTLGMRLREAFEAKGRQESQAFQAGEAGKGRAFTAGENAKGRAADLFKTKIELGSREAIAKAKADQDKKDAALKAGGDMRKEVMGNKVVQDAQQTAAAFAKVKAAATVKAPQAADDMALIFGYMKILDPGSTVREGEYASAKNTTGVPGQIINLYNQAKDGKLLNAQQRGDFLSSAEKAYGAQSSEAKKIMDAYAAEAQRTGVDPASVSFNLGFGGPAAAPAQGGLSPQEAAELHALEQKYGGAK